MMNASPHIPAGIMPGIIIEAMTPADWPAVRRIYAQGIATGQATFETEPPSWDAWHRSHLPVCRLVARAAAAGTGAGSDDNKDGDSNGDGSDNNKDGDSDGGVAIGGANAPGAVLAWAALSPVSARACYAGVAEHSVYVDAAARGRGIGKRLLAELVRQSEAAGIWTLQSSVFPENGASLAVHLACGFRILGRRKRVAMLNGVWRDTVIVERRSDIVGVADDVV